MLFILAVPILAEDKKFDADARAKAVAPFLDEQTVVVVHADLTRIDINAIATKLTEYAKPFEENVAKAKRELGDWLEAWTKAGVHDMYVVVSQPGGRSRSAAASGNSVGRRRRRQSHRRGDES